MLKRNLVANYLGQGWTALMGLVFVPIYIKYVGMEAYGLIGLFTVLQVWFALLDMGMTPTLTREMSRFTGGAHTPQSIRDLLRSLEVICAGAAVLIAFILWGASEWLASNWLQSKQLPITTVAGALAIMGIVIALRFMEGLYRGALIGLQRQVLFNVANSSLATVRGIGALVVLAYVSPTIGAFFVWQGVVSICTVAIFALVVYRTIPASHCPSRFSLAALKSVGSFAIGMIATNVLALLLTQSDKIILSRILSLEDFGNYSLAAVVAGSLSILVGPIAQAYYPRMTELAAQKNEAALINLYHTSAQMISVLVGSAAMLLILFGERLVGIWTGDIVVAEKIAPLVALLAAGTLLNSFMIMPYMLQLAHGWSSFAAKVNLVAVSALIPTIIWVTPRYGAVGAACVWVALNSGYVFISIHFMHRRLIPDEKWRWYFQDIGRPLSAIVIIAGIFRLWQSLYPLPKVLDLCRISVAGFIIFSVSVFFSSELKTLVLNFQRNRKYECLKKH